MSLGRRVSVPATLIYDGDCGLCTATAAWLARRVSPERLDLVSITEAWEHPRVGGSVVGRDLAASVHLVGPDGSVVSGARAVLGAGRLVPRWRVGARLFDHRVGHVVLEPVYRLVARNRLRIGGLLGLPATCPMPAPHQRPSSQGGAGPGP